MPELPEVETIARGLGGIVGRRIAGVEVRWAPTVATHTPAAFSRRLRGQRFRGVRRRGKWLVFALDGGDHLLVHLRMSGRLVLDAPGAPLDPHARVLLTLDDGWRLLFSDTRKFGRMLLTADPAEVLAGLGPEPLELDAKRLTAMLSERRALLKPLLLDQRFIAGLGNIYTDEALWQARIHPRRPANTLSGEETARLHEAIQSVLRAAIARKGTTLDDARFVGADGEQGGFAGELAVYQRAGEPCSRCGERVVRTVVGGRGTHTCPACQPAPA